VMTETPRVSARGGCFRCGKDGHFARNCTEKESGGDRLAGVECYGCHEKGHFQRNCTKERAIPHSNQCSHCNRVGHVEKDCRQKPCSRCGYRGHRIATCLSRKHYESGKRLADTPPGKIAIALEEDAQKRQSAAEEADKKPDF
jgi:hypothetical protein